MTKQDTPDYWTVERPDKPLPEYDSHQRRAWLLHRIVEAGHPRRIHQSNIADKFDVSHALISRDVGRVREYMVDAIDETTADSLTETVYQAALDHHLEENDYEAAVETVESRNDWLFDRGRLEKEPEKQEHAHSVDWGDQLRQAQQHNNSTQSQQGDE